MADIAGYPYAEIVFKLDGQGRLQPSALPTPPAGVTDLVIVSHGWHMDAAASQNLYRTLIGNLATADAGRFDAAGRKVVVWGVFWPSDRFRDDLGRETEQVLGGQAASAGGELHLDVLRRQARGVAEFLGLDPAQLAIQAELATGGGGDADTLANILRAAAARTGAADADTQRDHKELLALPGSQIVDSLGRQNAAAPDAVSGGGAAAGFHPEDDASDGGQAQGFFSGATAGVAKLLNQVAYYELKKRAGLVGERLGTMLDAAPALANIRLHLVGHSFGARLVTAAAKSMAQRKVASMTLLQAAFSHNSFGANLRYGPLYNIAAGGFRDVLTQKRVTGPIAITHTWRDEAVGLAYPAASRVSQTISNLISVSPNFGGSLDVFGGLGANGARGLTNAEGTDVVYTDDLVLPHGRVTNILCDAIENHNDVDRIECARIVRAAMALG
ncbi:hypothetical protein CFHF_00295 [Caulobacter flavus]|uniref:Serine-threonine protein kinase n=1 Tax=Caulobacter flavus TaxID=1679497 RepID=A0A2N5D5U0_9CAUL|nr:hypothetical protein [Caulobacter flavus]AYV46027.1 hypothetical protein C1707_07050 [Caulobacter flavus]PLR21430.1 hypothetical protein CFHF_00295 [Caulobacter flavus]